MNIGKQIMEFRKKSNLSQADLATKTGISQVMVGKYERGDAIPSIEVAKKIADTFEISLDALLGEGQNVNFDKKIMDRIIALQSLDENTQSILFNLIDTYIQNFKAKQAFGA
ncbi:MAG: helix-turn-helix transcriptional regulator [Limnohabitans sp.]|nr:helix-turn-helix transcriptional regulator [Limnohabitans sp.]